MRGTVKSRPQVRQRMRRSEPTRKQSKASFPQACFFSYTEYPQRGWKVSSYLILPLVCVQSQYIIVKRECKVSMRNIGHKIKKL